MKYSLFETLVVALIGGLLFSIIKVPLPWMLGPLTTVAVWKTVVRRVVYWPVAIRNAGLIVLGCMIGISFTRDAAVQILHQLPSMFLATIAIILFSILMGWLTYKGTGVSLSTAIIGSVPGGLTQMTLLAEEIEDADTTVITFMQTARLLSAVFIVPFIVIHGTSGGGLKLVQQESTVLTHSLWVPLLFAVVILFAVWLAVRLHFPVPFLLGSIIGASVLVLSGAPTPKIPHFLSVVSQLFVGTYLGASLKLTEIKNWKKMLLYAFAGSLAIVIFSLINGAVLSFLFNFRLIDAFLCTAPGGIAEMGLTALMVHADVSMISSYQLFRVLFILFILPSLLKRWFRRRLNSEKV